MTADLIAVLGNSPGVGKSTLCAALAGWLRDAGVVVDHFEEAEFLTRTAFAAVAEEFDDGAGSVRPRTLVEATRTYVEQARTHGVDVVVADALLPFIPSLVAWGHDETAITGVVRALEAAVAPTRVIVVYLRDAPEIALRRAIVREGEEWERWYVDKLGRLPGTRAVHDLASAARHLRGESDLTLRVLAASRWDVVVVDVGGRDSDWTSAYVRGELRGLLGAAPGAQL